ncbi:MAG TPA: TVP38/TMEM64 family protein [Candidatus Pelethomonas intestinigallinarum]|nr:TVP38/TMEM64 family protein [Candidatus Pelethomonas intestinigallinarum]
MGNRGRRLTEREKRWIVGLGLGLFLVLFVLVAWYAGRPLVAFASEPERFQQWVDSQGLLAPVLFMGMVILQVVVAVIPGEPLEIAAGYAFGALEGTVLCVLGTLIGGVLVFLLVRRFGAQAVEVFFDLEKFRSLRFFQDRRRLTFWVFLVFFLPGTPKDVLCYFVGLTDMRLRTWILVSAVARIPSIITSTVGGSALGMGEYAFAAIAFLAALAISGLGLLAYRAICRFHERRES